MAPALNALLKLFGKSKPQLFWGQGKRLEDRPNCDSATGGMLLDASGVLPLEEFTL
jgi:hypothetical protein